jgi:hypothetical protein
MMILRIIGIMIAAVVILFVAWWIWTGGITRGLKIGYYLGDPYAFITGSTTGGLFTLPGQSAMIPDTPDTIDVAYQDTGNPNYGVSTADQLNALQNQYSELSAEAKDPKNFGNPSPYQNKITFGQSNAQDSSSASEYVTLQASFANTAPISLAGWSLQSAVTGVRIALPQAAPQFVSGVGNNVAPVTLSAGSVAYVVSGPSPVGVSFRENSCTGYLAELQVFTPELNKTCPSPSDELSLNAQNISQFGDACVDYARSLPQCHFPGLDQKPAGISDACASFLLNRFSYNGCVYAHKIESDFYQPSWRLYLGSGANIWRDTHDVVRLLDDQGRTVDVLQY